MFHPLCMLTYKIYIHLIFTYLRSKRSSACTFILIFSFKNEQEKKMKNIRTINLKHMSLKILQFHFISWRKMFHILFNETNFTQQIKQQKGFCILQEIIP